MEHAKVEARTVVYSFALFAATITALIDPLKALQLAEPRAAATTPPPAPTPTLRQR